VSAGRWRRALAPRLRLALPVLAAASALLAANIWAYRHLGRVDLTSGGVYTISDDTRRVIARVQQPLQITWFYDQRNKSMVDALALLDQYARANPAIRVRGVDPAVHPADARRHGIQFAGSAVFESGGRTITVNGGTETDFTNALIRATTRTVQTLCFTHGHAEANPFSLKELDDLEEHDGDENLVARVEVHERHGLGMARDALETLGYTLRRVLLLQGDAPLRGCHVVVAAGPKRAFRAEEAEVLDRYLAAGGSALLMLEPGAAHGLQPVLDRFGIQHHGQEVMDPASHYRSDPGSPAVSDYPRHRITRQLPLSFFPGASSFTPAAGGLAAGVTVTPLALTSEKSTLRGSNGEPGSRTLMLLANRRLDDRPAAQGGRQASLLLVGDADFASNTYYALLGNGALFVNAVNHLAQQEQLLDIRPRHYEGKSVQLTNRQMQLSFFVSSVLLPLLALALGAWRWWRQR
jgi:ABC-type uncharacterized transport system involved in gliding motility auxiliary subunit